MTTTPIQLANIKKIKTLYEDDKKERYNPFIKDAEEYAYNHSTKELIEYCKSEIDNNNNNAYDDGFKWIDDMECERAYENVINLFV